MYNISQRREAARRLANPSDIPVYRQLLRQAGSSFCNHQDPNPRKLAVFLVSALLGVMTEEDIVRGVKRPQGREEARAAADPETAREHAVGAVKKKSGKTSSFPASAGRIWTTLSSGLRTLFSRTPSTSPDGSGEPRTGSTKRR